MRRSIPILLVLCLLFVAAQPAAAGGPSARQIERITRQIDRLVERLIGSIDSRDVTFKRLGGGFHSVSYALPAEKPTGIDLRADDEKPLRTLSCGHMLLEPTTPSSVSTAVVSNIDTQYNLWWAAVNHGEVDEERRTTVKLTGPEGFDIEVMDDVPYPANSVTLIFFNPFVSPEPELEPPAPFAAPGIYTHKVTVKGAGKASYRFWVEPLSTTPAER